MVLCVVYVNLGAHWDSERERLVFVLELIVILLAIDFCSRSGSIRLLFVSF